MTWRVDTSAIFFPYKDLWVYVRPIGNWGYKGSSQQRDRKAYFPTATLGKGVSNRKETLLKKGNATNHACGVVVGRLFGKYSVWPRLPTPSDAFSRSFFQNVQRHSAQCESLRGELQNIAEVFFLVIVRYGFMCRPSQKSAARRC